MRTKENIFIDTCIYQEGQFFVSGKLKTLFDAAKEERICILLPDITEREVLAHIEDKLNDEHEKLKKQASSILKHLEPLHKKLEEVVKLSETAANDMKEQFLKQLKIAKVRRIPLQENLDLKAIIDAYFRKEPPFSQKKKSEFPDAIVLKSLEMWCKENNENCIVLSNDNDMRTYSSEYLHHINTDDYLKSLTKRIQEEKRKEEEIKQICATAYANLVMDSCIQKAISEWIQDQLDNEMIYASALQIEDINNYSIGEPSINFADEAEMVGTYNGMLVYKVTIMATTEIEVNHPDYDTGYYDGEDKQWYFVDDDVKTKMTSELEFDIEFTTYQDGDDPELESINSGRHLSTIELHNSLSYGYSRME